MTRAPQTVWQALALAWDFGFIIALPLVGLGLLGKYLDSVYGTKPWLALAGILIAIALSSYWLYRHFAAIMAEQKDSDNSK